MSNTEVTVATLNPAPQGNTAALPGAPGGPDSARLHAAVPDIETLKARITKRLETGRLTEEQVDRALRVVDAVGDPVILDKFLKNGGVALLAKLDGLPAEEQRDLVNLVARNRAYLHTINEFLDKYHDPKNVLGATPEERNQKLREFIAGAEQIGDAARLNSLMQAGGVAKVIATASGISSGGWGGPGGGPFAGAGPGGGVFPSLQPAQMVQQLEGIVKNLAQAFSSKPSLSAMIREQQLEQALLQLSSDLEAKRKKGEEEEQDAAGSGIWPSKQAAEDLKLALKELAEIVGPEMTGPLQQLVQVLNRGGQLGLEYSVDQLLALLKLLKNNGDHTAEPSAPVPSGQAANQRWLPPPHHR